MFISFKCNSPSEHCVDFDLTLVKRTVFSSIHMFFSQFYAVWYLVCVSSFRPTIRVVVQIYSDLGRIVTSLRERNEFLSISIGWPSRNVKFIYLRSVNIKVDLWDVRPAKSQLDQFVHSRSFIIVFKSRNNSNFVDNLGFEQTLGCANIFQLF